MVGDILGGSEMCGGKVKKLGGNFSFGIGCFDICKIVFRFVVNDGD